MNTSPLRWLWLSGAVVALDQATKLWSLAALDPYAPVVVFEGFFNFMLAFNTGAAFSFLADAGGWQRWLLSFLSAVVTLVLTIWLVRLKPAERSLAPALALIIGGAVGNLIDRVRLGHVVDFLDFYHAALAGWPGFSDRGHWPAFNLADSAIVLGVVWLLLATLRQKE